MALKSEEIDHINTVNWFRHQFPELKDDFHHFANERFITPKGGAEFHEGRKLKRMGVTKGVLDFHLAFPCNGYHGLWVELKVGKGRLEPEQKEFIQRKNERGYHALAVWGFEAAKEVFSIYLKDYIANRAKQNLIN